MNVVRTVEEMRSAVSDARARGARRVGLVPTMGALHVGHFSLIDKARAECDFVVVSIFVNPTQFGPNEDYRRYPRPLRQDLDGCEAHGVDAVFVPEVEVMYPAGFATVVHVAGLTEHLCGASRPGHFDGVCTVVTKLLNIVAPDVAYFGAKDYQQAVVVRRMTDDLNMPVRIEVCPTVREDDGLAVSSRNAYLTAEERAQAVALIESLRLAERRIRAGGRDAQEVLAEVRRHLAERAPLGKPDYVEIVDERTLRPVREIDAPVVVALAVKFPSARLIDNIRVDLPDAPG